ELTAELTAELTQRKKQYNHYRDQLLTFDEDEVEWKVLGDVAEFRRGTAITKKQTKKGKIPVVANGPISTYSHGQHNRDGETVVVARSGAYAGYVSYWNQPIFLTDAFSVHPASNLLLPKFVFYLLQNKQRQLHDMKKGAGVPHVRVKEVEQYGIPIPSLTEQANIVAILDKFDTLTTSISEGLPREIELREKQYAYYRDQLLSFPKPNAEAA
ncbi:MAG: restriction endonuclease subunit S, partial [Acetobacter sp.]|uniref:restriction endonuclease subunit S n=1 Tax=Acetobacter sp. TaxID=440 RepID=UPI0039EA9757